MHSLVLERCLKNKVGSVTCGNNVEYLGLISRVNPCKEGVAFNVERGEVGSRSERLSAFGLVECVFSKYVAKVVKVSYGELISLARPSCIKSKVADIALGDLRDRLCESVIKVPALEYVAFLSGVCKLESRIGYVVALGVAFSICTAVKVIGEIVGDGRILSVEGKLCTC